MIRHFVSPIQDDWDMYLSLVEFVYNLIMFGNNQTNYWFMLNFGQHFDTIELWDQQVSWLFCKGLYTIIE
jgi:hypothetical protein